ncbi:MAG: DNA polymerase III subunit beta [Spirochaetaceae bacterium]|nr:MAG: DNA polymerase III subunit beta [Spirochaetaceae bacterium]
MIFLCDKEILLKEMLIAHDTISTKSTISILSNVLLIAENDTLYIKATDLKVAFSSQIKLMVKKPGSVAVFCDRLLDILRALPAGEIEFSLQDNLVLSITPKVTKAQFELKCIPADKFPPQQEAEQSKFFDFSQKDFVDMVTKTIFAISDDETRFFLNGVFLEKNDHELNMVASDGRRLALIAREIDKKVKDIQGVIIPPKILSIVKKNTPGEGNLSMAITDKNIFIRIGVRLFSSNLIDGKFPNYQKIIPEQNEYSLSIKRQALAESLKRVSVLVENKTRSVFFKISPNLLSVSSEESEIGMAREEIECEYSGPEVTLTFNYLYILEPLQVMNEDVIQVDFNDQKRAVVMKPKDKQKYINIIMPLQTD